MPPVAMHLVN